MNKRILFVGVLLSLLVVLSACSGSQGQQEQQVVGAYLGGQDGITVTFEPFGVKESDVYSLFDEETFPLEVRLENKGEYELKPGDVSVRLLGPAKDEFTGIASWELKNKGTIEKRSDLVPEGGEEIITFASEAKYAQKVNGALDRDWFANVEYNYKTFLLVPEVCLKEDLRDTRVCNVKETKDFASSSAPIIVESVEQDTAGKGIMALKIKIRNVNKDNKVAKPNEDFGVTHRIAYSIEDAAWECKSAGKLNEARFSEGTAEIVCKLKQALPKETIATKQIRMTFDYKYRQLVQEKIRFKESVQ